MRALQALCALLAAAAVAQASSVLSTMLAPQQANAFLQGGDYGRRMLVVHRNNASYYAELRDSLADVDSVVAAYAAAGTIGRGIKVREGARGGGSKPEGTTVQVFAAEKGALGNRAQAL